MAWKTLADALKSAIAQGQIAAETGVGAPDPAILAKSKRTPTEAGAKFTGQRRVEGDDISDTASSGVEVRPAPSDMDRGMLVAAKAGRPTQATSIPMFMVIQGGRQPQGGTKAAGRTRAEGEIGWGQPAREFLRLVVG
jgi:hypothetical protein